MQQVAAVLAQRALFVLQVPLLLLVPGYEPVIGLLRNAALYQFLGSVRQLFVERGNGRLHLSAGGFAAPFVFLLHVLKHGKVETCHLWSHADSAKQKVEGIVGVLHRKTLLAGMLAVVVVVLAALRGAGCQGAAAALAG
ncbi:MAG: hypothetical protein LCH53_03665 [Bacteroidetes bacterium]|nr:hypothetical protein [Bacteroidota bacterium]